MGFAADTPVVLTALGSVGEAGTEDVEETRTLWPGEDLARGRNLIAHKDCRILQLRKCQRVR